MEKSKIKRRLSALENAQKATEMMTDADCMELYRISKEQCLKNLRNGIRKAQKKLHDLETPKLTGAEKIVTKIATDCIVAVEFRGDLEARMRDDDDFFEVGVWELKKALLEAYEAGKNNN